MAQFIPTLLAPGEKIVLETELSWFEYIPFIAAIIVEAICAGLLVGEVGLVPAILLFLVVGAATALVPLLERKYSEFVVTNRRVIVKTGIISRNVFEMPPGKIESVDLSQSIGGRIFDYGTLVLHGTGDTAKVLKMIESPVRFRKAITG